MSCVPQRKIIDHGGEFGSVGERFNPSVLKTEECNSSVSSNLTASAKFNRPTNCVMIHKRISSVCFYTSEKSFILAHHWRKM